MEIGNSIAMPGMRGRAAARAVSDSHLTVRAPGKVFVAGEYSVLAGGWSAVATVGVHAQAHLARIGRPEDQRPDEDPKDSRRFVSAITRELDPSINGMLARRGLRIALDLSRFYVGEGKLGVGSSAAGAAAVAGLVSVLRTGRIGRRLDLARSCAALHRSLQGGLGSGADAAACCTGGVILFRIPSTIRRASLPPWLSLVALGLGGGGRTTPVLDRHREKIGARDVPALTNLDVFGEAAAMIIDGMRIGDWNTLRVGVKLASLAYEELSGIMGFELVTARDRRAMGVARRLGGASRPTGAGGGDLHLAYFPDPENAGKFAAWARSQGFVTMPIDGSLRGIEIVRAT